MPTRQKLQSATSKNSAARKSAPARKAAADTKVKPTKAAAVNPPELPTVVEASSSRVAAAGKAVKVPADPKPAKVKAKAKAKPVDAKAAVAKPAKEARHKHKLVRDSFTMPREDFELIHALKERALGFRRPTKKSELLRAGLRALLALDDSQLHENLNALISLSPGRPKKHH